MGWEVIADKLPDGADMEDIPPGYRMDAEFLNTFLDAWKEKAYLLYPRFTGFDSITFETGEAWTTVFKNKIYQFWDQIEQIVNNYNFVTEAYYSDPTLWLTSESSSGKKITSSTMISAGVVTYNDWQKIRSGGTGRDFLKSSIWSSIYKIHKFLRYERRNVSSYDTPEENRINLPYYLPAYHHAYQDNNIFYTNRYLGDYPDGDQLAGAPYVDEADHATTVARAKAVFDAMALTEDDVTTQGGIQQYFRFGENYGWISQGAAGPPYRINAHRGEASFAYYKPEDYRLYLKCYKKADDTIVYVNFRTYLRVGSNYTEKANTISGVLTNNYEEWYTEFPRVGPTGTGANTLHSYTPDDFVQGVDGDESYLEFNPFGSAGEKDFEIDGEFDLFTDDGIDTGTGDSMVQNKSFRNSPVERAILDLNAELLDFYIAPD